jgi:putative Ca2+/H+ antiporter (TMEM165/GDT1 family)
MHQYPLELVTIIERYLSSIIRTDSGGLANADVPVIYLDSWTANKLPIKAVHIIAPIILWCWVARR